MTCFSRYANLRMIAVWYGMSIFSLSIRWRCFHFTQAHHIDNQELQQPDPRYPLMTCFIKIAAQRMSAALHCACRNGQTDIALALIDIGADIDAKSND